VRAKPLYERCVFVAPLIAPPANLAPPPTDGALAVHRWTGAVEPLDQMLFASRAVREAKTPRLQKDVAVAVAASLALWDAAACDSLVRMELGVLKPQLVLADRGTRLGWDTIPDDPHGRWAEGIEDQYGGSVRLHSAALAVQARQGKTAAGAELERRIWEAQVGVLFPFVEQARRSLVEELDKEMGGPFQLGNGQEVKDIRDLEIGQLHYILIGRRRRVPLGLELLRSIRNDLAHLQTVSAETLRNPDLERIRGR